MPVRFLTDAVREQLSGFPAEFDSEALDRFFTFSDADRCTEIPPVVTRRLSMPQERSTISRERRRRTGMRHLLAARRNRTAEGSCR
jgi:hypothetical protein